MHQKKMEPLFQDGEVIRLSGESKRSVLLDNQMRALLHEFKLIANDIKGMVDRCVLTETEQRTTKHLCGMLSDIGGDNPDKGVEEMRSSISFVKMRRQIESDAGRWILKGGMLIMLTALFTAIWYGIKAALGRG